MNFVRFFKKYGSVDIAYSQVFNESDTGKLIFSNEYKLKKLKFRSYKTGLIYRLIMGLPQPLTTLSHTSQTLLLSAIDSNNYDFIIIRYFNNSKILFKMKEKYRKRTIIDYDDLYSESLYKSLYGSVEGHIKNVVLDLFQKLNRKMLINYEKKCPRAGASLFCAEKDMRRINSNLVIANSFVVPNTYDNVSFEKYDFGDGFKYGNTILFIGTLSYQPNIDGLKWFIKSVFPVFREKYPDARLLVVGRFPTDEIKQFCGLHNGIELYPDVPDIKIYYRKCKGVVVPLLTGGGTRIKILEAALAARPVLSTSAGSEGLDFTDGADIMSFRDAQEFLLKYGKLEERTTYDSIVFNAKKTVLTRYVQKRFYDNMNNVLNVVENSA